MPWNAAVSGANGYPDLSLKVGAPAKAAYAMMDNLNDMIKANYS
ncbi:MAG: hypothetical protein Q8905_12500 [Bacteroidota bacterium]|nr:hypothetical protein [Bacteroidota bacterium]